MVREELSLDRLADRSFRVPVWSLWYLQAVGFLPTLLLCLAFLRYDYRAEEVPTLMTLVAAVVIIVVIVPVSAMLGVAFAFLLPVKIGPAGIRCGNFWGVPNSLEWHQMHSASLFNLLGLRYAIVSHERSRWRTYVPLFLRHRDDFFDSVKLWAPPDNPLHLLLIQQTTRPNGGLPPNPSLQRTPPG
jgi:hypothetical protein